MKTFKKAFCFPLFFIVFFFFLNNILYAETCTSPYLISVPGTASGHISSSNRYDYYEITFPAKGTVHAYTTGYVGDLDAYLYREDCSYTGIHDESSSANIDISFSSNKNNTFVLRLYRYNGNSDYTLHVDFTPDPANAVNDSYSMRPDNILSGENILDNDDGYNITVISNTNPSNGTLSLNSDGTFTYTPTAGWEGTDTFTYTITDASGNSDTATVSIVVINQATTNGDFKDFSKRVSFFAQGDMVSIGNTFTVAPFNNNYRANCSTYTNGSYYDPITSNNSERRYCHYNVDGVQGEAATRAELNIPSGSTIKWAGLYWQALTPHRSSYTNLSIKIRKDGQPYQSVIANEVNYKSSYTGSITPVGSSSGATSADLYSAFADVTKVFQDQNWKDGNYTVATADVMEGRESNFGVYGAWNLIVVYEDRTSATYKSFTVFDGWKKVSGSSANVPVTVSGFYTPKSLPINAKVAVFAAEGDYNINGDKLKAYRNSTSSYYEFLNSNNPSRTNQTFSAMVQTSGTRTPSQQNNNGIDIQIYDIGTGTSANLLQTEQTSLDFTFTSTGDLYFPSVLAFSTEIYTPKMCYDYSIKQDGHYLNIDRDSSQIARIDSLVSSSDIGITIYLKNKEADISAEGISIRSDLNATVLNHVGNLYSSNTNGSMLIDRGVPTSSSPLCAYSSTSDNSTQNNGCTDGHNIRKGLGTLGSQEYVYTKFILQPQNISGITDMNESLGLTVDYYITIAGNKIIYNNYQLGSSNVPLCPPSGAYQPTWGQFNVVKRNSQNNNLNTQISRKPFDVDVIFDSSSTTGNNEAPTTDVNTTVLVEIIDIDAFGDINASCANPDSSLTDPVFVPISFDSSNWQTAVVTQANSFYNFAVKNAAFRIWYFNDSNGTLIQNWTANTINNNKTLTSISGLYDSATHTACASDCSTPTSTSCFNCIRNNYAKPLCSRDNFSVRPESYDVRIYDDGQSSLSSAPKNDLSVYYGYDTSSFAVPISRIQLAGGYNYRFDINSTGHDNTQNTPGYTRYFNGGSDYSARFLWDSTLSDTTPCNDTGNQNIIFYMSNGALVNQERNSSNVGEYKFNIIDTSWTAVDWDPLRMTHHSSSGFLAGTDCSTGSTSSVPVGDKYGCVISTNHGSDGNGHFYRDASILFHPYTFDLNGSAVGDVPISPSVGLTFNPIGASPYVYYADINKSSDENMSYHISGNIVAVGADDKILSNFVDQCYAVPLKIDINTSNRALLDNNGNNVAFVARFHDLNTSGSIVNALDINYSSTAPASVITFSTAQTSSKGYFPKAFSGKANTRINMNYKRAKNITINPKTVSFITYKTECLNAGTDCTFSADMQNNKTTKATRDLNATVPVKFFYGRTHTGKQRFEVPGDSPYKANIYYEIYCYGATCNTALLPSTQHVDDIRWYRNTSHVASNDGNVSSLSEKGLANKVIPNTLVTTAEPATVNIPYDGTLGYPYTTTMEVNASSWLIYNENNASAVTNPFQAEYNKAGTGWSGKRKTTTTTKASNTSKINRRTMW